MMYIVTINDVELSIDAPVFYSDSKEEARKVARNLAYMIDPNCEDRNGHGDSFWRPEQLPFANAIIHVWNKDPDESLREVIRAIKYYNENKQTTPTDEN